MSLPGVTAGIPDLSAAVRYLARVHWLGVLVGVDSVRWSAWWGGFASDIPEFAILAVLYRKFECHALGCHRIALHHVQGTSFVTCKKHHPTSGNTAEQIIAAHSAATTGSSAPVPQPPPAA